MALAIVEDSNEQQPWVFDPALFAVERRKLRTGDYTVAGLEDEVCVERKSLGDLVGTVTHDVIRFKKQLVRMAGIPLAVVVVEADVSDLLGRLYESEADPVSVLGRCHSFLLDFGVPTVFAGPRPHCVEYVSRLLLMAAKRHGVQG